MRLIGEDKHAAYVRESSKSNWTKVAEGQTMDNPWSGPMELTMKKLIAFVSFLVFLVSSPSLAGISAPSVRTDQGKAFLMCSSDAETGEVCDDATPTTDLDYYAIVSGFDSLTFLMVADTSGGVTCEAYGVGHYDSAGDAVSMSGTDDLATLTADSLFSTSLSITQSRITLTSIDLYAVFMVCTDAGGGMDVTVEMRGSYKDWDNN